MRKLQHVVMAQCHRGVLAATLDVLGRSSAAGLANTKTLDISASEGSDVQVTVTRPKNKNKPGLSKSQAVSKKRLPRKYSAVQKQVSQIRPDLQVGSSILAITLSRSRASCCFAWASPAIMQPRIGRCFHSHSLSCFIPCRKRRAPV